MTEEDMLPCPFCGSKPTLWPMNSAGTKVSPYCEGCGATFDGGALPNELDGGSGTFATDEKTAVEYWNRRVTPNSMLSGRNAG